MLTQKKLDKMYANRATATKKRNKKYNQYVIPPPAPKSIADYSEVKRIPKIKI